MTEKSKKQVAKKRQQAKRKTTEAAAKGGQVTAMRTLAPVATKINKEIESADKFASQAEDHRLAAALLLAKAKQTCSDNSISFKTWCEDNLDFAYSTARNLAAIGAAANPAEALSGARAKNKASNKQLRERQKEDTAKKEKPRAAVAELERQTPVSRALSALDVMPEDQVINFLRSQVEKRGYVMITREEAFGFAEWKSEPRPATAVEEIKDPFKIPDTFRRGKAS